MNDSEKKQKSLGFLEAITQAVSLIFAVQNHAGRKRLMDLAETNPLPVIVAGLVSTVLFFSFCFITSQFFIYLLTK
ncbi:hypothetical protein FHR99_000577 [Litorivivens lipolytica]|uniref:DUF2970 domain-containing protein n=1 Tax=Litorivivens lipolytica TaxID=1524264 RepID=A0A7W4W2Q4_9GAMM|nr:DUF2970 domain-containing protein [Litorivivens lipolytica]MBB3046341.1 hypothetical protein [Litorivivens lipolytica]